METTLGPFTFSSRFECGNLAKVLLAGQEGTHAETTLAPSKKPSPRNVNLQPITSQAHLFLDYKFNLWTQPDCAGTEFENSSRTWFCFNISGGIPGQHVKLTMMNLNRQTKLFSQGMLPVFQYSTDCLPHGKWARIKDKCTYKGEDGSTTISWVHTVPEEGTWTFYAFTYPYLYSELQSLLGNLEDTCKLSKNPIYYHKELMIESLDGNRLDLVTITSHLGKQDQREDYIPTLFPDWSSPRPHLFTGKKVVMLSARVHPGETSSSFVMKGFLNFIVSDDLRAVRLRDLFIFKFIPMLNPDGVVRGHYRSDQKGVNLNRVYSNPCPTLHPTIYAARKIILYYHFNMNLCLLLEEEANKNPDVSQVTKSNDFRAPLLDEDTCHSFSDAAKKIAQAASTSHGAMKPCATIMETDEPSASGWDVSSNVSTESFAVGAHLQPMDRSDVHDDCSNISYLSEHETGVTNMFSSLSPLRDLNSLELPAKMLGSPASERNIKFSTPGPSLGRCLEPHLNISPPSKRNAFFSSASMKNSNLKTKEFGATNSAVDDGSKDRKTADQSTCDDDSGLYLYVDLHGHASKRGIFIFGNWFSDPNMMVENMLFPKLLSLNCSNFDFSACNFSEKNMYGKVGKDGTTKEGSGRVAVMRSTGILRSYTLECNYNTGRTYNHLPASPLANRKPTSFNNTPPKYTPAIFEDCGRELGVSLLDLKDLNDWSRIPQSQFTSVNGIRNYLHLMLSSPKAAQCSPIGCGVSASKCVATEAPQSSPSTSSIRRTLPAKTVTPVGRMRSKTRAHAWSLSVDAENLEPASGSRTAIKAAGRGRSKSRSRLKPATPKKSVARPLTFTDIAESTRCPCVDKLTDTHNLSSSVTLTPTLDVELCVAEGGGSKAIKKLQKPLKQRRKSLNLGTKKLKTSTTNSSSEVYALSDDMDFNLASNPTPLSPRSPLASVCEPQMGHSSGLSLGKAKTAKKKTFHASTKGIAKSDRKSLSKNTDKLPAVATTGHKVKIIHKKVKKTETGESSLGGRPTASVELTPDSSFGWLIEQTFPPQKKPKKANNRKAL